MGFPMLSLALFDWLDIESAHASLKCDLLQQRDVKYLPLGSALEGDRHVAPPTGKFAFGSLDCCRAFSTGVANEVSSLAICNRVVLHNIGGFCVRFHLVSRIQLWRVSLGDHTVLTFDFSLRLGGSESHKCCRAEARRVQ